MIRIFYENTAICAENDGTPIDPPSYWTQEIFNGIAQSFANGDYETIVETEPMPEPDWTGFNIAILTNNYWANWAIMADLRTSIISASVSRLSEQLQTAYDLAKSLTPPSAEAIEAWQSIADQYYVPIVF